MVAIIAATVFGLLTSTSAAFCGPLFHLHDHVLGHNEFRRLGHELLGGAGPLNSQLYCAKGTFGATRLSAADRISRDYDNADFDWVALGGGFGVPFKRDCGGNELGPLRLYPHAVNWERPGFVHDEVVEVGLPPLVLAACDFSVELSGDIGGGGIADVLQVYTDRDNQFVVDDRYALGRFKRVDGNPRSLRIKCRLSAPLGVGRLSLGGDSTVASVSGRSGCVACGCASPASSRNGGTQCTEYDPETSLCPICLRLCGLRYAKLDANVGILFFGAIGLLFAGVGLLINGRSIEARAVGLALWIGSFIAMFVATMR